MDNEKKENAALDDDALEAVSGGKVKFDPPAFDPVKVRCPGCGAVFTVDPDRLEDGQYVLCSCGTKFKMAEHATAG